MDNKKIIFVVGPTAVGKTEVACALAKEIKAEIVSCDAMQVYREISILTGKASVRLLRSVQHHLVDILSVEEDYDVFSFYKKAVDVIKNILSEGKIPLVVGGSGLYMSILLDGIFEEKKDADLFGVRQKVNQQIKEKGSAWAFSKVKSIDPKMAQKIHHNDERRLARVLEVFEIHQKPISALHTRRQGLWGVYDIRLFALTRDRQELYDRINQRVEKMFKQGVEREVQSLSNKQISRTAQGIIGLKEIQVFLKKEKTKEQVQQIIQRDTRHFAKRQMTWFRKEKRLKWIEIEKEETAWVVAQRIILKLKQNI